MKIEKTARELALDILERSLSKRVRVGAVIEDSAGRIFAWGWNHAGADGLGMCAERHAISRANKKRIFGSRLTVAGRWTENNRYAYVRPCEDCMRSVRKRGIAVVEFLTKDGTWEKFSVV